MTERRSRHRQRRRLRVSLGGVAVYTADVTESGFSAELMHVLTPGHAVSGKVSLDAQEYEFHGKVVWARGGDSRLGQRGRMGVHFEQIDPRFAAAYKTAFAG